MKSAPLPIFGLLLVLTACGTSPEQQATLTATAQTATAAAWTATPTSTATATPSPTPTLTSTFTVTPTDTPTQTPVPTQTPNPDLYASSDGSFSLISPKGWHTKDIGMAYPALVGPQVGDYTVNIVFVQEESAFPVAFYSAMVQDKLKENLKGLVQVSEDFLTTDEGRDYFRWEIENTQKGVVYHQVLFFYESGDWKLIATYTRPKKQGSEQDVLVEEAMKTVRFSH